MNDLGITYVANIRSIGTGTFVTPILQTTEYTIVSVTFLPNVKQQDYLL
jgi:hypothetical protein